MKQLMITLAAIMIASIFAMVAPTTVADPTFPDTPVPGENYSSIRIYGDVSPHGNAPEFYTGWAQPFDPTVIPKDSITCNPTILNETITPSFPITVNDENAQEKTFLRVWYEPYGLYNGSRKNYTYPTINLEYTYMLVNATGFPTSGGTTLITDFMFPTKEKTGQSGLGTGEVVTLANITNTTVGVHNKSTNGTIRIEKKFTSLPVGEKIQFLDHKLMYVGMSATTPVVKVWYAGNVEDDTPKGFIKLSTVNTNYYFDRHNNIDTTGATHPDSTWYVRYQTSSPAGYYIGKELSRNDTFYVNGVRYDVTAVEVLDTDGDAGADSLKFITIRTKLPKGIADVPDESVVSTQRIEQFAQAEIIAVLPPFNEEYYMVDDIDIPLRITGAERDLTKQPWALSDTDDVAERTIANVDPLNMTYIAEDVEKRYSTDLLEKLNETLGPLKVNDSLNRTAQVDEDWTKFDVQTLPDQYTEFVLPSRPDIPKAMSLGLYGDYLITTSLIAPQATGDLDP